MEKKKFLNLYIVVFVTLLKCEFSSTVYKSGCRPSGIMMGSLPSTDDVAAFKTCYKQVEETRQAPRISKGKRTRDAILERGFSLMTYNVTTKDGYILTVFRITGSKKMPPRKHKPAVMLFHCISTASDSWFLLPGNKNKSLAHKLVEAGYDVWLPNSRGTDYSQGHVSLDANYDLKYWDFSIHEVALYDIPAILNLMLEETGNKKIFYVGYSSATNVLAIALAEMPHLNEKIEAIFWLGTALYTGHAYNLLKVLSYVLDMGQWPQEMVNVLLRGRVVLGNTIINPILSRFCSSTAVTCGLCGNKLFFAFGYDAAQVNYADVADLSSYVMNTVSYKMLQHQAENMRTCRFQKFNYGPRRNYKLYGQYYPPLYNLSNIRAPVYMWYGDSDNLATPVDQRLSRDALPPGTVKGFYRVEWEHWNHVDFIIAKDADVLVYDKILDIIKSYTNI